MRIIRSNTGNYQINRIRVAGYSKRIGNRVPTRRVGVAKYKIGFGELQRVTGRL